MVFSEEDKALITNLYLIKRLWTTETLSEFPEKGWKGPDCIQILGEAA